MFVSVTAQNVPDTTSLSKVPVRLDFIVKEPRDIGYTVGVLLSGHLQSLLQNNNMSRSILQVIVSHNSSEILGKIGPVAFDLVVFSSSENVILKNYKEKPSKRFWNHENPPPELGVRAI